MTDELSVVFSPSVLVHVDFDVQFGQSPHLLLLFHIVRFSTVKKRLKIVDSSVVNAKIIRFLRTEEKSETC